MGGLKSWLGLDNDYARDQQQRYQEGLLTQAQYGEESNRLYANAMASALAAQQANQGAGLISQFGLAALSDQTQRQALDQAQRERMPYQLASLSALQSLPTLQKMAGQQAYAMPTSVSNYNWQGNAPNYQTVLRDALNYSQGAQPLGASGNLVMADQGRTYDSATGQLVNDARAGATSTSLTPIDVTYNMESSPLYQFRQKEAELNMGRALRARGLYGSETGALMGAKEQERISAEETQNAYNRVMDLVKIGMGEASSAGNATATGGTNLANLSSNLGTNASSTFNEAAKARSGLYSDFGTGLAENQGQLGALYGGAQAASYTPASTSNPLATLANLYGVYSGMGGTWKPFS